MKLKKCLVCKNYTLKSEHCDKETKDAHYKYIRVKSESLNNSND